MESPNARMAGRLRLWPGLWIPACILLIGLAVTAALATVESGRTRELAETRYHYQHQTLVNLLLAKTSEQNPPGNTSAWLEALFDEVLPPSLGIRIDTLERHSKQPLFQVGTSGEIDPTLALRTEVRPGRVNWMLTTVPDPAMLDQAAHRVETIVWTAGITLSGLMSVLALLLCRRLQQQSNTLSELTQKDATTQLQMTNLQIEKSALRHALNDSEQRSRDLVALSGATIGELDESGKIGFISAQIAELVGRAPTDLSGTRFDQLIAAEYRENFQRALESARADQSLERIDLSIDHPEEERTVPAVIRILALHDPVIGLTGFRISVQPLTHA